MYGIFADSIGFRIKQSQIVIPSLLLFTILGKFLNVSASRFPQLQNGNSNSYFLRLL